MATITSAGTGNFSAGATWVGGVVPGPADDAVAANGTVVTIDTDVTVLSFQQAGTGKFVLGGGRTVTGNVIANAGTFTSGGTVEVTATTGQTATINGNVTGVSTTTSNTAGIVVTGVGTLVLNGSVTGSAGNNSSRPNGSAGVYTNVNSTITINGAVTTVGSGGFKFGFRSGSSSNGTFTIVGNITGSNTFESFAVFIEGTSPTLSITGNITGGNSEGVLVTGGSAIVLVTGNIFAPNTLVSGLLTTGASTALTVIGNLAATGFHGVRMSGQFATATITGVVTGALAGSNHGAYALGVSSTINVVGSVIAQGTLGNGIRSDATANGVIFQGNLTDSLQGATAIYSRLLRVTATNTGTTTYTNTVGYPNGTPVTRVSPDLVTGMPATSNVRSGTVYGYNSELTGTVAIPNASAVAYGAEVDNTTGTAALDAGSLIAVVGQQVAAASSSPSVV